jgi:3alpha(or 20beta)-hydroxysteroid dehydrogenase
MARLEGKVAIVTGSAQGTGAVIARRFVEEGASVVIADVQADKGAAVADGLGGTAVFKSLDVSDKDNWREVVASTVEQFGKVDVLVNNAALLLLRALDEVEPEEFLALVKVNQLGPFLGMQAVLEPMKAAGGGSIVNISSTDGVRGMNSVSAYASTKWAVRGLTKSAAIELGKYAIRVNAVCPEAGNPHMSEPFLDYELDMSEIPHQMMQANLKARETAQPESRLIDVANMVLFLASDESMSCTAADFVVDAGLTTGSYQKGVPSA